MIINQEPETDDGREPNTEVFEEQDLEDIREPNTRQESIAGDTREPNT
jgi:hypothetical protein